MSEVNQSFDINPTPQVTQEQLDAEYTQYCIHLGDETTKLRQTQAKIDFFNAKIGELLNKGIALKASQAKQTEVPSESAVN